MTKICTALEILDLAKRGGRAMVGLSNGHYRDMGRIAVARLEGRYMVTVSEHEIVIDLDSKQLGPKEL